MIELIVNKRVVDVLIKIKATDAIGDNVVYAYTEDIMSKLINNGIRNDAEVLVGASIIYDFRTRLDGTIEEITPKFMDRVLMRLGYVKL